MKRVSGVFSTVVVSLVVGFVILLSGPVAEAGTPTTSTTTSAVGSAHSVNVSVPGIVGVDLESDPTWDFSTYTAAANNATCTNSNNLWPISITCAGETATTLLFDPTNSTDPGIGTSPLNSVAGVPATAGTKAIWLAFFCSRTSGGTLAISTTMTGLTSNTGITVGQFKFQGASGTGSNNAKAVGGTTGWTSFAATAVTVPVGSLSAPFPWTRADQFITLQLPNTVALAEGSDSASIQYTISK